MLDAVREMKPLGFWPADEGKGATLHDRSGHNNHGVIRSIHWRDGCLVFDNDFYQWIEVPHKKAFGTNTFTMGGWLYNCLDRNHRNESRPGATLIGHQFHHGGGKKWSAERPASTSRHRQTS